MADTRWIVSIPLDIAYLCVNCDSVGNQIERCASCGSEHLLVLRKILNRPSPPANGKEDSCLPS